MRAEQSSTSIRRAAPLVCLIVAAVVVRLPGLFASRHLLFDDGVYGSAALAMRDGAVPFRDLFSPQGPLHFPMLWLFDIVGFHTLDGPRLYSVAAGVVATVAVYSAARRLSTPSRALVAAAIATLSGSLLWVTVPITGDGPAVAWACVAFACAVAWRDRPRFSMALCAGLALGCALATKVSVAPVAVPMALIFLERRAWRPIATAALATIGVVVCAVAPFGVQQVYDQSVKYHIRSGRLESVTSQAHRLFTTLITRDVVAIVAALSGLTLAIVAARRGGRDAPASWFPILIVAAWFAAGVVVLLAEKTFFRNHVGALVPPLALLVALCPPPRRLFTVALIVLVPITFVSVRDILWPQPYAAAEARVVHALRRLPRGAWVISDEPGLAWRAGRRMPALLDDASVKRVRAGMVDRAVLVAEAARPQVCAFVQWSSRYRTEPNVVGIDDDLVHLGYRRAQIFKRRGAPDRVLWTRDNCHADTPDGRP